MITNANKQIMSVDQWEGLFASWKSPLSETETTRCENAEGMIRDAIKSSPTLSGRSIRVFTQGSHRNRTNVRQDSDIDVCIHCDETFYYDLEHLPGVTASDLGITPASYHFSEFREEMHMALIKKFGDGSVKPGDKSFKIRENSYRVCADVVPAFSARYYTAYRSFQEGVAIVSQDSGKRIFNFPEQHYMNGVSKHDATGQQFKKQVRILKRLRNKLESEGFLTGLHIPSFLIESLVWNCKPESFTHTSYYEDTRSVLIDIFERLQNDTDYNRLFEVNNVKYLFHDTQRWSLEEAKQFIFNAWCYVGFSDN